MINIIDSQVKFNKLQLVITIIYNEGTFILKMAIFFQNYVYYAEMKQAIYLQYIANEFSSQLYLYI